MSPESQAIPFLKPNSIFFPISRKTDQLMPTLHEYLGIKRERFEFRNSSKFESSGKGCAGEGDLLSIQLNLPSFPAGIEKPQIFVLGTPENEAVSLGKLELTPFNNLAFMLARFHTGYAALKDMSYSMRQALYIDQVRDLFKSDHISTESFIIHITREGPMMRFESSLYNVLRKDIPYTSAHCSHQKTSDPGNAFGRIAEACPINFEGLNPAQAKLIVICDNTASGMQHVKIIEDTVKYIDEKNGGHNVLTLLIVSPLLTAYGATNISYAAAHKGIRTVFVCSAHLLDCKGPKRYFSPVLAQEQFSANPALLQINRTVLGNNLGKACARCNWTASFSARETAWKSSEAELTELGTSNQELLDKGFTISPTTLREMGIKPEDLIPYSTYDEARFRGIDLQSPI
jgi:hypothetical protein